MRTSRRALSLSTLIRTRAIQRGILGTSPMWRAIALLLFGRRFLKRILGKRPEHLSTEKLAAGQSVQIAAIPPPSREERRGRRGVRRRTA